MGRASRRRRALGFRARPVPMPAPAFPAEEKGPTLGPDAWRGLDELAVLREEHRLLDRRIDAFAVRLAELGVSWGEIGRALGMSPT